MSNIIKLIIFSINLQNKSLMILTHNDILPYTVIDDDIKKCISRLLSVFFDTSQEWMLYSLIGAYNINCKEIELVYTTIIPEVIKNKSGKWKPLAELLIKEHNDKEIISLAAKKVWS